MNAPLECRVHHRSRRENYGDVHYCVLHVRLPAGRLLGLAGELEKLSSARATHQFIVSGWRNR